MDVGPPRRHPAKPPIPTQLLLRVFGKARHAVGWEALRTPDALLLWFTGDLDHLSVRPGVAAVTAADESHESNFTVTQLNGRGVSRVARGSFEGRAVAPSGRSGKGTLRPMLIRLSDASLSDDLCAHFRRSGFGCDPAGGSMIEVRRPDAPRAEQERRELELHLRVWKATRPEVVAELLD